MSANPNDTSKLRYFAPMLHIDLDDLNPDQYYLLGFYRKWIGLYGEPCKLSLKETGKAIDWEERKVRRVRNELITAKVIWTKTDLGRSTYVYLVDRRKENNERYEPLQKNDTTPNRAGEGYPKSVGESPQKSVGVQAVPLKEIEKEEKNKTDVSNDTSPAGAKTGIGQPQDMVSQDHFIQRDNMVVDESTIEENTRPSTPSSAAPPSPDPLFASVARLQFGIENTALMLRGGKKRVQDIVDVIEEDQKLRSNVTALSPNERLGLAGMHAKFWIWFTKVKYPPRDGEQERQLKSPDKVAEYWQEYRSLKHGAVLSTSAAPTRYTDDPYFAGRDDDDDLFMPIVTADLPPRQIDPLDHGTARHWEQALAQSSNRLPASDGKAFEQDVKAIGMVGRDTIVIEFADDDRRKKFVKGFMAFVESQFNRFDDRASNGAKPPINFSLVVKGDNQYREGA